MSVMMTTTAAATRGGEETDKTTTSLTSSSISFASGSVSSAYSCACAKGRVNYLSASAIQKTQVNNAKKNCSYVLDVRRSDGSEYRICRTYGDIIGLNNSLPCVKQLIMEKKFGKNEVPKLPGRIERTKDLPKLNKYFDSLLQLQDENDRLFLGKTLGKFCHQDNSCDACCIEEFLPLKSAHLKEGAGPRRMSSPFILASAAGLLSNGSNGAAAEGGGPRRISSPLVLSSGRVIKSYKSDDKRQLSLQQNTTVRILKKCPTGWWFVISEEKSGWFPASYLRLEEEAFSEEAPLLHTPELYKADREYIAKNDDELSLRKNESVTVKKRNMDGWWMAELNGREGFVPAAYLRPNDTTNSNSNCYDMCSETLNMKPIFRRTFVQTAEESVSKASPTREGEDQNTQQLSRTNLIQEQTAKKKEKEEEDEKKEGEEISFGHFCEVPSSVTSDAVSCSSRSSSSSSSNSNVSDK